jgi:hypothetical protein
MFTLMLVFAPLVHDRDGQAARGRYLVENVAMCGDCHTPVLPTGQQDQLRFLMGAALAFQSIHPIPEWSGDARYRAIECYRRSQGAVTRKRGARPRHLTQC